MPFILFSLDWRRWPCGCPQQAFWKVAIDLSDPWLATLPDFSRLTSNGAFGWILVVALLVGGMIVVYSFSRANNLCRVFNHLYLKSLKVVAIVRWNVGCLWKSGDCPSLTDLDNSKVCGSFHGTLWGTCLCLPCYWCIQAYWWYFEWYCNDRDQKKRPNR